MGIVGHVRTPSALHSALVPEKQHACKNGRNRDDEEQEECSGGMQTDERKQNGTDRSRCTKTAVTWIESMLPECRKGPCDNSREVHGWEAHPTQWSEVEHDRLSKLVQHKHVEGQMHPIGMYKRVGHNPVPFSMGMAGMRNQHPFCLSGAVHQPPRNEHRGRHQKRHSIHRHELWSATMTH